MHFRNQRWSVTLEKRGDLRRGGDEVARKLGVRGLSHNHQKRNPVTNDGVELIGFVADATVVGHRNPAVFADGLQPFLVGAIGRKVVAMPLDRKSALYEDVGEGVSEIAIGEKDQAQAARS